MTRKARQIWNFGKALKFESHVEVVVSPSLHYVQSPVSSLLLIQVILLSEYSSKLIGLMVKDSST